MMSWISGHLTGFGIEPFTRGLPDNYRITLLSRHPTWFVPPQVTSVLWGVMSPYVATREPTRTRWAKTLVKSAPRDSSATTRSRLSCSTTTAIVLKVRSHHHYLMTIKVGAANLWCKISKSKFSDVTPSFSNMSKIISNVKQYQNAILRPSVQGHFYSLRMINH